MKTRELAYTGILAALIAVCSWISIPTAVPFTLQTFAVFLTLGLLGGRLGTLAVTVYLLLKSQHPNITFFLNKILLVTVQTAAPPPAVAVNPLRREIIANYTLGAKKVVITELSFDQAVASLSSDYPVIAGIIWNG